MYIDKKDEQPLRSSGTVVHDHSKKKRRRCIICSTVIGTILTIIALIILILSLTVFKPKKPIITVDSITLQDLNYKLVPLPLPPKVSLNLSLDLDMSIDNPNKVSVKYRNSSAILRYRGKNIGDVLVPAGKIGSNDKSRMNLTLTVFADRLVTDSELYRDLFSGELPFTAYTKIKAKVRVLFINFHVTSTSTCDVNIDIQSQSVKNQTCHTKIKL
uniref:uncharacterized protein LOC122583163 n=1 Tax=Erigeron canadensis TaxID=72917 RepID=UPI001CB890C3|nr:uncharacterized protein LOC122583163 [Erigeron canadensis]